MMRSDVHGFALVALLLWSAGCGETDTSTAPDSIDQPTATDDIQLGDPGPPPAGQSEPPLDADPNTPDTTTPPGSATPPVSDSAPAAAPVGKVELQITDWAGVEKLIAAHQGKVVVVDVWSTSCPPCMAEFPNLVNLHKEAGEFVACISVSADYDAIPSKPPETYRDRVLEFLVKQQATFENVLCSEYVYDVLGIGSIPAVYVYNQTGKQVKVFADPEDGEEFNYAEDIRPFVQSLLLSQ